MRNEMSVVLASVVVVLVGCSDRGREIVRIERVIDAYHAAAARADLEGYIGLMSDGSVFLGTDASERWTRDEFRAFCEPYFAAGRGWTYVPVERHVEIAAGGRTAWFDEILSNESYGTLRSTGVLSRDAGDWRIEHYSLSFLVPNDVAKEVVKMIREEGGNAD